VDPYRGGGVVREQARARVAEPEKPPGGVRVRAWNDGTTELRLSSRRPGVDILQLVEVTPAAILVRRRQGDAVMPRGDAVRVEVVATRVAVMARDSHLVVADALGYDASTLRWIAQRLQRALEDAR